MIHFTRIIESMYCMLQWQRGTSPTLPLQQQLHCIKRNNIVACVLLVAAATQLIDNFTAATIVACTVWRRCIECRIFMRHFPQNNPIISGSFAERDLQLKASYASLPPYTRMPTGFWPVIDCLSFEKSVRVHARAHIYTQAQAQTLTRAHTHIHTPTRTITHMHIRA